MAPAHGITDKQGQVHLKIMGDSPDAIRALYIKPASGFWSLWLANPVIQPDGENTVSLTPLSATFQGFPKQPFMGWGQRAMKLDQLPPIYRGKGVKIAIIDSGVA